MKRLIAYSALALLTACVPTPESATPNVVDPTEVERINVAPVYVRVDPSDPGARPIVKVDRFRFDADRVTCYRYWDQYEGALWSCVPWVVPQ